MLKKTEFFFFFFFFFFYENPYIDGRMLSSSLEKLLMDLDEILDADRHYTEENVLKFW